MKAIVLIGFMSCGKTEIGKALRRLSNFDLVDTDDLIVIKEKKSISNIFNENGEEYFRDSESDIVKRICCNAKNLIISTGGGVVLREENMNEFRKIGVIYYLNTDFNVIKNRVEKAAATRPLMQNRSIEEIKQLYDLRQPQYLNCDYIIDIDENKTATECASEILDIHFRSSL